MLINRASLSLTVDAINAAHFDGRALAATERGEAARWIAARQGLPGAYGGTFAGFPPERSNGIVLFTGERIASASARHILGEEASRALRLLRVRDRSVTRALDSGRRRLDAMSRARRRRPTQTESRSVLLRQVQRGLVAEPARRRTRSPRRAIAARRAASALGARRRTWMAEIPILVHGAGAERDEHPRSKSGVEACGAGARAYGGPPCGIGDLRAPTAGVGGPGADEFLARAGRDAVINVTHRRAGVALAGFMHPAISCESPS